MTRTGVHLSVQQPWGCWDSIHGVTLPGCCCLVLDLTSWASVVLVCLGLLPCGDLNLCTSNCGLCFHGDLTVDYAGLWVTPVHAVKQVLTSKVLYQLHLCCFVQHSCENKNTSQGSGLHLSSKVDELTGEEKSIDRTLTVNY